MANYIRELTGWEINNNIYQKNIVARTGESAEYRRKNIPEFDGEVDPNAIYIIVDDVVTSGGTLAQLKGHIENNGGSVGKMITLGGAQFSTKMKPTPEAIQKLKNLYGNKLGKVLNYVYGKGTKPEQLTQSEAKHLGSKKVHSQILDEIRNKGTSEGIERGRQKDSEIHPKSEETAIDFIESKPQKTSGTPIPAKGKPGETYAGAINLTKYPEETRPIIEAIVNQLGKGAIEEARGRRV